MKQVNLPLDVAKEMYKSAAKSLNAFALANYTKEELEAKELPKTWEELDKIDGCYVYAEASINITSNNSTRKNGSKTIFATKEQAEASIALAQLSQLIAVYNDGWIPDWETIDNKYIIHYYSDKISALMVTNSSKFLAFKTAELRDEFLKNFKDLIEQAKPLL